MKRKTRWAALAFAAALTACGGGDEDPSACSVRGQQNWLADYMNSWYFWYALSPRPNPAGFGSVDAYFDALLYTGGSTFPADRWSYSQSTEAFNRFFGDGQTLGYGVSVAALELERDGSLPLYVRYIEPASPAAAQGVQRGDRVLSINGRSAASVVNADDFAALTPDTPGQTLTLELRRGNSERTVTLSAAVFALTPVTGARTFTSSAGRRIGYVAVKDMISQAQSPLDAAFARFRADAVQDVVLDLRYNGGGLVSTGGLVASYIAGMRGNGRSYARLLYNDKRASSNTSYAFTNPSNAAGLPRVFVLMGRRTCSASEQVINGLRGVGVDVVAVGETSCGKPVGFLPTSQCGRTYSAVNFESVNERNEGRYFDGFAPTCAVAESFTTAQGVAADPLLAAATAHADTGLCPLPASSAAEERARALAARPAGARGTRPLNEGDGRPGMIPR